MLLAHTLTLQEIEEALTQLEEERSYLSRILTCHDIIHNLEGDLAQAKTRVDNLTMKLDKCKEEYHNLNQAYGSVRMRHALAPME